MAFGGIAGVVSTEPGEGDDHGQMPSIRANPQSNEATDMQDVYRRTLAASWTSRTGDTPADRLIESLFSGSSALSGETQLERVGHQGEDNPEIPSNNINSRQTISTGRLSPSFIGGQRQDSPSSLFRSEDTGSTFTSNSGRSKKRRSIEQQLYEKAKGKGWKHRTPSDELSEFDVREDLRSWEVSAKE